MALGQVSVHLEKLVSIGIFIVCAVLLWGSLAFQLLVRFLDPNVLWTLSRTKGCGIDFTWLFHGSPQSK